MTVTGASRKQAGLYYDKGGAVRNIMHPDYGALGNGSHDESSASSALLVDIRTAGEGIGLYPPNTYLHNSAVADNMPDYSALELKGATLTTPNDIVLFDLHSSANPASPGTKITNLDIEGGNLICTAIAPAVAAALKLLAISGLTLSKLRASGWKYGLYIAGQDSYTIGPYVRLFNNDIGIYVPNWSTVAGGETQVLDLLGVHFAGTTGTYGMLVEGHVNNLTVIGGSSNLTYDSFVIATIPATSNQRLAWRDHHFESQGSGKKCIWVKDVSGTRTLGVTVQGCSFGSAACTAIKLENARGIRIGENVFSQTTAAGGRSIDIDANCLDIVIDMDSCFFADLTTIAYACPRSEITFLPEIRTQANPRTLTGYNGNTFTGTSAATIDVSAAISSGWPTEAPPKGYWVILQAKDSGSASAACHVGVAGSAVSQNNRLRLDLQGEVNSAQKTVAGYVACDANGDFLIDWTATGTNTLTVYLVITAIHM